MVDNYKRYIVKMIMRITDEQTLKKLCIIIDRIFVKNN